MKNQIPISKQDVETLIREHLPEIVRRDPSFRQWVLEVVAERFADKAETDSRFEQLLAELREERQEFRKQWQEQRAEWREYQAQMEERWQGLLEGYERRWEEHRAEWREYQAQMEERWQGLLEGYERRWEEHRAESEKRFQKMLQRVDTGISAIGARWGIFAESAFRNGIQAILEESFGVQVLRYQGYDPDGEVFGHPDQVELDLIIRDGLLIVCEIKSSMSRSDMYTFDRKVRFYERQEGCQAHRRIVISPMVEKKALQVAQKMGIEVYSHADDVPL